MRKITKVYLKSAKWFLLPLIFTIIFCISLHYKKITAIIIFCYTILAIINGKNLYYLISGIPLIKKEKKQQIEDELVNPIYDNNDVILTNNFIISCENLQVTEYKELLLVYQKTRLIIGKPMGIKGEIVLITKKRKIKIPVEANGVLRLGYDIEQILEIIVSKNSNVLVGKTKENKMKLKKLLKGDLND